METLHITEQQATLRIDALFKSEVLKQFPDPDSKLFQFICDIAIQIPQIEAEKL